MQQTNTTRILIVDSHTIVRQGLRVLLDSFSDLEVVGEADDGFRALGDARALRPDVILFDIPAAGDGEIQDEQLRLIVTLRREVPSAKVIALTTLGSEPHLVYQALRAGAMGYICKDTDVDELVRVIRSVAGGQAALLPESLTNLVAFITQSQHSPSSSPRVADRLSLREQEVLELVAEGCTNRQIAAKLFISESTVRSHLHNILDKLDLNNRVQAATFALTSKNAKRVALR